LQARVNSSARGRDPGPPFWRVVLPGLAPLRQLAGSDGCRWLDRLLARADAGAAPGAGLHGAVAAAIAGDERAVRRHAPAVVCAREDGIDEVADDLLRLDPVTLSPAGDHLLLGAVGPLDGDAAERLAAAIGTALDNEPRPRVGAPTRWYARLAGLHAATWTAPETAFGRDVYEALPSGPGSGAVRRLLNEIQMVLHDHPVNVARRRAGLPEINSVWPWGWAGAACDPPSPWDGRCFADHPYARGLARLAGGEVAPAAAPAPAGGWSGSGLKVCDAPWLALQAGDEAAALAALAAFDAEWCEPLLRGLQRGRIAGLQLDADETRYTLGPASAWRLWRRRPAAEAGG
jgi:hypothetical protein